MGLDIDTGREGPKEMCGPDLLFLLRLSCPAHERDGD